jgi:hypothetical protein
MNTKELLKMEDSKYCIIGDLKFKIISITTEGSGFIKVILKPHKKVVSSDEINNEIIKQSKSLRNTEAVVSDKIWEAIEDFIERRKQQFPNFQVVKNATPEDAIGAVWKLLKKGYDEDVIIECIRIGINDDFWKRNLMTLTQLNKKCKDELTKFEHLLMIYEEKKKPKKSRYDVIEGPSYEEL